ncbi:response regulator transcription factor [Bacillus sp. JCM 19034]|uniref:response regulator transcription factor n=1 Tax=Bacillus sp. JCM 19034 TaxID=1481928 RepID=UPI0007825786|nr:response regulator transcription factor [Bacillus sp. JCM 19034]
MKVVIIDDEKAMHLIIKRLLGKITYVEVVGCFHDTKTAYSFLQSHEVNVAFVDISMPWENGLDFAKRLRETNSHITLVFITSHKEHALAAYDVYAYDYIVKPLSQKRLQQTVERINLEKMAHEERGTDTPPNLLETLTKREHEILRHLSSGKSNKEIAVTFKLTEGTVKNHLVNIFGKLQVKNRVQATVVAKKLGVRPPIG